MQAERTATDVWFERGKEALEEALSDLNDDPSDEAISKTSLALACLQVAWGDKPDPDLEDVFREPVCTCDPALVARGGWSSKCSFPHGFVAPLPAPSERTEEHDGE